jgi:hypothetical protein
VREAQAFYMWHACAPTAAMLDADVAPDPMHFGVPSTLFLCTFLFLFRNILSSWTLGSLTLV